MTQFSGFAPNYYFGQHNKGLSIYSSPGSINGIPFNGQVPSVSPQSTTTLWINSDDTIGNIPLVNSNNLLVAPNDFTNAAWVLNLASLAQANNQLDPLNGNNASSIDFSQIGGSLSQSVTPNGVSIPGTSFTFLVFLRASSGAPTIELLIDNQNTIQNRITVTLSTSWRFFQITAIMQNGSTLVKPAIGVPSDLTQNYFVYFPQLILTSTVNITFDFYPFALVTSGTIDTGGNIVNPNILDDGILNITDIRIR